MKVKVSKGILQWMYDSGMTVNQMVAYLNENYGGEGVKFTPKHVKTMFEQIGLDLRKKSRPSFQIEITEDDEPVDAEDDNAEGERDTDPYQEDGLEEIPNFNHKYQI
jgi:hypothetical protein